MTTNRTSGSQVEDWERWTESQKRRWALMEWVLAIPIGLALAALIWSVFYMLNQFANP